MEAKRTFWQRFNDPNNELNRKDFIVTYLVGWVVFFVVIFLLSAIFSEKVLRGAGIGLLFGFFQIFVQRLRYLGMNKWWAVLGFTPATIILFIYLAIQDDIKKS